MTNWLAERLGVGAGEESPQREQARPGVAALLVEVLRADYDVSGPERRQVLESIRGILGLDTAWRNVARVGRATRGRGARPPPVHVRGQPGVLADEKVGLVSSCGG